MKVTVVKASWCPHCEEADRILSDLQVRDKYRDIPVEVIDEEKSPQEAAKYKYDKIPNFWVNNEMIFEGEPTEDLVKKALETAMRPKGSGGL